MNNQRPQMAGAKYTPIKDNYYNTEFSKSFNSLILDDDKMKRTNGGGGGNTSMKSKSKSPERPKESSIKRSSKFLNLSLDLKKDVDPLDLNEINIESPYKTQINHSPNSNNLYSKLIGNSNSNSNLNPSPNSQNNSPNTNGRLNVKKLNLTSTPIKNFKRPHQLISKSPSPHILSKKRSANLSTKNGHSSHSHSRSHSPNKINDDRFKLRKMDSSPIKFDYYKFEDLIIDDNDSPSKNRKNSNNSSNYLSLPDENANHRPLPSRNNSSNSTFNGGSGSRNILMSKDVNKPEERSFNFVKPYQIAFKSSGLLKKNSTNNNLNVSTKLPPETPIKKHPIMLFDKLKPKSSSSNNLTTPKKFFADDDDDDDIIHQTQTPKKSFSMNHYIGKSIYNHENHSEISIEVGRNQSYENDSTISLFKIDDKTDSQEIPQSQVDKIRNGESVDDAEIHSDVDEIEQDDDREDEFNYMIDSTPTKNHKSIPTTPIIKKLKKSNNLNAHANTNNETIDNHLNEKFGINNIKYLSKGEFSIAFECNFDHQKFAIKRSKKPIVGKLEIKNLKREIEALRTLTSVEDNETINLKEQNEGKEYLVYFIEAWEFNNYYYIMTELCEGGTLFNFLEDNRNYKIDEFRIWKILIEILGGLKFIHSKNYLHLDLKPANIFITFEGSLKIGDFGLSTKLPILEKDFDLEGDRNYIAPELINDKIYTPFADIFSVGLIILEIATNIILPDNGTPWRKLRSGDLSDAGKLSSDNISDFLHNRNFSSLTSYNSITSNESQTLTSSHFNQLNQHELQIDTPMQGQNQLEMHPQTMQHQLQLQLQPQPQINHSNMIDANLNSNLSINITDENLKNLIPSNAPKFLVNNSNNLDKLVSKMLSPNPFDRLTASKILEMDECMVIENIRKAGATIYEGEFGPIND